MKKIDNNEYKSVLLFMFKYFDSLCIKNNRRKR